MAGPTRWSLLSPNQHSGGDRSYLRRDEQRAQGDS